MKDLVQKGRLVRLILALLSTSMVGCAGLDDVSHYILREPLAYNSHTDRHVAYHSARAQAKGAWQEVLSSDPQLDRGSHFERGFFDGYVDYTVLGGNGLPPILPPSHYWGRKFQNAAGQQAIAEWYSGFGLGTELAQYGCRSNLIVPSAHSLHCTDEEFTPHEQLITSESDCVGNSLDVQPSLNSTETDGNSIVVEPEDFNMDDELDDEEPVAEDYIDETSIDEVQASESQLEEPPTEFAPTTGSLNSKPLIVVAVTAKAPATNNTDPSMDKATAKEFSIADVPKKDKTLSPAPDPSAELPYDSNANDFDPGMVRLIKALSDQ
jgi:hypothetical protein